MTDNNKNAFANLARVVISTKDVALLIGRTERSARKVMQKMRKHYSKAKDQLISVSELAAYLGIPLEEVIGVLKLRKGQ